MTVLDITDLHASLRAPVLGSFDFLNEVMLRYPEAISFAPGAPHPAFFDDIDVQRSIDVFLDHLVRDRGFTAAAARRLIVEYGPNRGIINHLLAEALRRDQGIDVPAPSVVVTVGAQEAILLVLRALFRSPADVLAVANPCYVGVTGAAQLLDVTLVPINETDDGIDIDLLELACRTTRREGHRIRACYVATDFSNPGGTRMTPRRRSELLALAAREDFLVLEDNTYGFTAAEDTPIPCLKTMDVDRRVIYVGSSSKVCFPGARVGYVIADQRVTGVDGQGERLLADELAALKSMVTMNTSPVTQAVIGGMLLANGGSIAEFSRDKARLYRRNLGRLLAALDRELADQERIGWNRPEGGFFVRVRLPVSVDLDLLEISAAEYGVLWTPMAQFYLDGTGDNQLRLACSYLEPDEIDEGAQRLGTFLRKEVRP